MKCSNCGKELLEGAKFCIYCGHKVEIPEEQETIQEDELDVSPMPSKETIRAFQSKEKTFTDKIKDLAYDQWCKLSLYGKVVTVEVALFTVLLIVSLLTRKIPAICIVVIQFALVIAATFYHIGIIDIGKKKKWMKWLMLCMAAILTVLDIMSYSWGIRKQYSGTSVESNEQISESEKPEEVTSVEPIAETEEETSTEQITEADEVAQSEQSSSQDERPDKNGFNSNTNEVYTLAQYTIEIPAYWEAEVTNITDGIQRYAETGEKVAMLQITAQEDDEEDYPVTFDGLASDNDKMIESLERTMFQKVTDYEEFDTGVVKGMLYKGSLNEKDTQFNDYGLSGYGEWFIFPSEADRKWCSVIIAQTDNTDYSYIEDFKKMLLSIKKIDSDPVQEVATEALESTASQESSPSTNKDENLTVNNCPELAAMLANKADLDASYADFARKYNGRTIEFDGRIDYCAKHGNTKTRFDYLVSAGDYDPNHQTGPAFKFNDVNHFDLNTDLATVNVGQNVHIIAKVESYNSNSGLFFLDPVSVTSR